MRTLRLLSTSGAMLVLAIYLFGHSPTVYAQDKKPKGPMGESDDPNRRQVLTGDADVKDGKVTIPFFPPFAKAPSCSFPEGEVVRDSPEFVELKNVKAKKLHYECKGQKREDDKDVQLVHAGIYPAEVQPLLLPAVQGQSVSR